MPARRYALLLALLALPTFALTAAEPSSLPATSGNYPRVFFFRGSEGAAANPRVT